jgi:heme exporter protein A
LAKVGLYGYEDVPSHALSAGQHRRVNLARLYLSDSPLWLLDEPFTAIDKAGVAQLEALLVTHVEAGGAVVMTSHQALQVRYEVRFLSLLEGVLL